MILPQGNKSVVVSQVKSGKACVWKEYNDNGLRSIKCRREVAFYEWFRGIEAIPQLVEVACPKGIWISRVPGEQLASWVRNAAPVDRVRVSQQHGQLLGGLLTHSPDDDRKTAALELLEASGAVAWESFAKQTIDNVHNHFTADTRFDTLELHQAAERAATIIATKGFWGEPIVCKLDWNAGNTLIASNDISGYVDFEQSF